MALIKPLIPPARRGGRRRTTNMRSVVEAILYIASSGCQWRMLPGDFPPVSTVRGYFYAWRAIGLWQSINQLLVMAAREIEGREAQPSAGIIDSQSVATAHPMSSRRSAAVFRGCATSSPMVATPEPS